MRQPCFFTRWTSCVLLALITAATVATAAETGKPGGTDPTEGNIAKMAGNILQKSHYSRQKFDENISKKFFDRYLDSLDPLHCLFLQSDLREFDVYRAKLDELTLQDGDTSPAHVIFARFMVRMKQRTEFVNGVLATNKFDFSGQDKYTPDRHESPRPKDIDEAREIWRQQVRFEYLQERLSSAIVHLSANVSQEAGGGWTIRSTRPEPLGFKLVSGPIHSAQDEKVGTMEIEGKTNMVGGFVRGLNGEKLGYFELSVRATSQPDRWEVIGAVGENKTVHIGTNLFSKYTNSISEDTNTIAHYAPGTAPSSAVVFGKTTTITFELGTNAVAYYIVTNAIAQHYIVLHLPSTPASGLETKRLFDAKGTFVATLAVMGTNYAWIDLEKTNLDSVVKTIRDRYNRVARDDSQLGDDDVLQIYVNALANTYDPHTDYMGHFQLEDFAMSMKLSLSGIGALLQATDDGYCEIKELYPGPAMKSKQIHVGDRIVAVGQGDGKAKQIKDGVRLDSGSQGGTKSGAKAPLVAGTLVESGEGGDMVDVVGMRLTKIVQLIRGSKGSVVKLVVIPVEAGENSVRKNVTLVRDEIKLEDHAAKAKLIEIPVPDHKNLRLGVIDLPSFYANIPVDGTQASEPKSTTVDVAKLLVKLNEQKVDGVILDLRRNGGGSLEEAITLSGLFIKEGPIVQVKDYTGDIAVEKDRDPSVLYSGPLEVLTSRFSASASEILAGALQDYDRALIVGDSTTHGKGTVQTLVNLAPFLDQYKWSHSYDPGVLKLTIKKFYRPSGASTQLNGVLPDVVLPSVNNFAKVGEKALENPLKWDEVASANFTKVNEVKAFVPALRKLAADRIAREQDFAYVREDIESYKKALAEKSVSLNEADRRKEKMDNEAKMEARIHEERLRPRSDYKTYEITLQNVGTPGLPAPMSQSNAAAPASSGSLDEPVSVTPSEPSDWTPSIDVALEEGQRVLTDYINLRKADAHPVAVVK